MSTEINKKGPSHIMTLAELGQAAEVPMSNEKLDALSTDEMYISATMNSGDISRARAAVLLAYMRSSEDYLRDSPTASLARLMKLADALEQTSDVASPEDVWFDVTFDKRLGIRVQIHRDGNSVGQIWKETTLAELLNDHMDYLQDEIPYQEWVYECEAWANELQRHIIAYKICADGIQFQVSHKAPNLQSKEEMRKEMLKET